ncbi:MAG: hypothetical protein QM758_27280 [Armatimonas sp.]
MQARLGLTELSLLFQSDSEVEMIFGALWAESNCAGKSADRLIYITGSSQGCSQPAPRQFIVAIQVYCLTENFRCFVESSLFSRAAPRSRTVFIV